MLIGKPIKAQIFFFRVALPEEILDIDGERAGEAVAAALVVPEHLLHRPGVVLRVHYREDSSGGVEDGGGGGWYWYCDECAII